MNIAVFLPNWIGDAVMATPALRALRSHFPAAHITGILKPYIGGVLEGSPWLDSLLFLDKQGPWRHRWPAVAYRLRQEGIDLAVLLSNTFRSGLVAKLGGCQRRVGYVQHGRGWLLNDRLQPVRDGKGKLLPSPVIDAYNRLVEHVGCPHPGYQMELFTTPKDEAAADAVWQQSGLDRYSEVICLNPGAAFGAAKHWPVDYFVELARKLSSRQWCGILVLCGPGEKEEAHQITQRADRPNVQSLVNFTPSLGLTKACIRRSDLLITTDSGPRHFAAAFGRPVVTLFGPTHIAWTETYYSRAIHLQKPVPCGPCQQRICPIQGSLHHQCMKLLTPGEVHEAATRLLDDEMHGRQSA